MREKEVHHSGGYPVPSELKVSLGPGVSYSFKSTELPHISLENVVPIANLFCVACGDKRLSVTALTNVLESIGVNGKGEVWFLHRLLQIASEKQKQVFTEERKDMLAIVDKAKDLLRPKIQQLFPKDPNPVVQGRFPGRGKRRPAGHGPYRDEGEF